jgi:hypothetical protein
MSHTPGPWRAVYVGSSDWDLNGPVTEQDWRLAAAAPELLGALRVFVSCSLPVSTEIDERGHRWTEAYLDQALPMARAAIAKAEGVQS